MTSLVRLLAFLVVVHEAQTAIFGHSKGCVDGKRGGICIVRVSMTYSAVPHEVSRPIVWKKIREETGETLAILGRVSVSNEEKIRRKIDHRSRHSGLMTVVRKNNMDIVITLIMSLSTNTSGKFVCESGMGRIEFYVNFAEETRADENGGQWTILRVNPADRIPVKERAWPKTPLNYTTIDKMYGCAWSLESFNMNYCTECLMGMVRRDDKLSFRLENASAVGGLCLCSERKKECDKRFGKEQLLKNYETWINALRGVDEKHEEL